MEEGTPERRSSKRKKSKSKSSKKKKKHHRSETRTPSPREPSASPPAERLPEEEIDLDRDYTHQEIVDLVSRTLDSILSSDPLLSDLPPSVTLEEVNLLIAHEKGLATRLILRRQDGTTLAVIVPRESTVADLKRAIQEATRLQLARAKDCLSANKRINWKYVWRTYWLCLDGYGKLKDDSLSLLDCGIKGDGHQLSFIRRLREK